MIQNILIENFKAIHAPADLPLQPFTVFIGNNGTGKSSVMEALRMLQTAVDTDLNEAFKEWGGLDKVRNYNAENATDVSAPLKITIAALVNEKKYNYSVEINLIRDYYVVESETLFCNNLPVFTSHVKEKENYENAEVYYYNTNGEKTPFPFRHDTSSLLLSYRGSPSYFLNIEEFSSYIENWQFLYLNPHIMGVPIIQNKRFRRREKLNYDGKNIAEYLLWLRTEAPEDFSNLIRKMQFVLPYIKDLVPHVLEQTVNKEVEILLYEKQHNSKPLPGWLLSSGTLRILALLAMFDTPDKPTVLFIDEIENGLDPRTIGLLLSQIESVFTTRSMQVVVSTHSPYFLDLVPIESLIVSEKDAGGSSYHIPKDENSLQKWRERFSPGKLYTMGKLTK